MINCGVTIYKNEGWLALYKGLSPFVAHLTLKYALRFGTFGMFKKGLGVGVDVRSSSDSLRTFMVRAARRSLAFASALVW